MSLINESTKASLVNGNAFYSLTSDVVITGDWYLSLIELEDKLESIDSITFWKTVFFVRSTPFEKPLPIVIKGKPKHGDTFTPTETYVFVNPPISVYNYLCYLTKKYFNTKYPEIESVIKRAVCTRALSLQPTASSSLLREWYVRTLVEGIIE